MMNPRNIGPRTRRAALAVVLLAGLGTAVATGLSGAAPNNTVTIAAGQTESVNCNASALFIAPVSPTSANASCVSVTGPTTTTTAPPTTTTTAPPTTTTQPPGTTTTTQPPPAGHALIGLYNNGDSAKTLGISHLQVTSDYAYGAGGVDVGSCSYSTSGAQAAKGTLLFLGVGNCTAAQDEAIGQALVAGGQPDTVIRLMWEMNNGSWFPNWNEKEFPTAAGFKAAWITSVNAFRSVPGSDFKFDYNPTACNSNVSGRQNFDSYAGTGYTDYIGIDVYDNNGSVAASQACITADAQFAQSQGLPMTIPEWGMYSSDDPAFVNQIYADSNLPTFYEESLFSASFYSKGSSGYSITKLPNSLAAFKADLDGE